MGQGAGDPGQPAYAGHADAGQRADRPRDPGRAEPKTAAGADGLSGSPQGEDADQRATRADVGRGMAVVTGGGGSGGGGVSRAGQENIEGGIEFDAPCVVKNYAGPSFDHPLDPLQKLN